MRFLSFLLLLLLLLLPTHWAALVVWALVVGSFLSFSPFCRVVALFLMV